MRGRIVLVGSSITKNHTTPKPNQGRERSCARPATSSASSTAPLIASAVVHAVRTGRSGSMFCTRALSDCVTRYQMPSICVSRLSPRDRVSRLLP
ncbi:MAG: hypothetical protein B7Z52_05625, partial [Burkholderiales bacterium 12-64-5]